MDRFDFRRALNYSIAFIIGCSISLISFIAALRTASELGEFVFIIITAFAPFIAVFLAVWLEDN